MFKQSSTNWAPQPLLVSLALFAVLLMAVSTWAALQHPWLGITLETAGEEGVRVIDVDRAGPLANDLKPGDIIQGIIWQDIRIPLGNYDPAHNPNTGATFQEYHQYLRWQGALDDALQSPPLTLVLSDNQRITFNPISVKPLTSLPSSFWLLNAFGFIACLIGISVWAFLPGHWPARLLALSGAGFFLAALPHSIWETRELALSYEYFDYLKRVNHVAMYLILSTLCMLLAIYPARIGRGNLVPVFIVAPAILLLANQNILLIDLPLHSFYVAIPMYYLVAVGLALRQWQLSRNQPRDRAALRWLLLSILVFPGAGILLYFLPLILDHEPLVSQTIMVGLTILLYIGFALGILRYRLFQLERWWFITWTWFIGGLSIVVIDTLIILAFDLSYTQATILTIVIVGWLYFPVRQWAWERLSASKTISLEHLLPGFVESILTLPEEEVSTHWRGTLQSLFQPLAITSSPNDVQKPELLAQGSILRVPDIGKKSRTGLDLMHGKNGQRLFTTQDLELVHALSALALRINTLEQARRQDVHEERRRIMRDLHDDVGGRLLTLIHTAHDNQHEELAREALGALRESIHTLDDRRRYSLTELLDEWQPQLQTRLSAAGWDHDKRIQKDSCDLLLPARHYINLRRILDEAITNALEHGKKGTLKITLSSNTSMLYLMLENPIPDTLSPNNGRLRGRGLSHIRNRTTELGGEVKLFCRTEPTRSFVIGLEFPLSTLMPQTGTFQAISLN